MTRLLKFAAGVMTLGAALPLAAQPGVTEAEIFGARQEVLDIALSPSGDRIVFIAPYGPDGESAFVVDLAGDSVPRPVLGNTEKSGNLRWCGWASDERLICSFDFIRRDQGILIGFSRIVILDRDGKGVQLLTQEAGSNALGYIQDGGSIVAWHIDEHPNSILMTRHFVKESSNGTLIYNDREGLAVERIDLGSLKRRPLEKARANVVRYSADENGAIRIMASRFSRDGYLTDDVAYSYRKKGSSDWQQFKNIGDLVPIAIDSSNDRAFAFGDKDGFGALYTIALDGSEKVELLAARDDADIDQLLRIGRGGRVVGASYATERREIMFFDKPIAKLAEALHSALPGNPLVEIIDSSADERKLLIVASSDTDPGMVYRLDRDTNRLEEVLALRQGMDTMRMGTMTPISYPAADGTEIPGYLTLPPGSDGRNLPAIVMPHGGPSSRDEWGFDWLAQYFAQRGFAVLQPNFRGSAGYGQDWYVKNGFKSWEVSVGDVSDAGRWLIDQRIADPGKLAIVGWSYGGYAALQSNVIAPGLFKATAAIAPVTDLGLLKANARDYTNFRLVKDFVGEGPHIAEGSPARRASEITSPVLLFHGDIDANVDVSHSRKMAQELRSAGRKVSYVEFEGIGHQLDDSKLRTRMLREIDQFIRAAWAEN